MLRVLGLANLVVKDDKLVDRLEQWLQVATRGQLSKCLVDGVVQTEVAEQNREVRKRHVELRFLFRVGLKTR